MHTWKGVPGGLLTKKVVCRNVEVTWLPMFKNKSSLLRIYKRVNTGSTYRVLSSGKGGGASTSGSLFAGTYLAFVTGK